MKRFILFITLVCTAIACTKTEEVYIPLPYDTEMIIGTWLYTHNNGEAIPSNERVLDIFYEDNTSDYAYPENGKWKEINQKYSIDKDGVIYFQTENEYFQILHLDDASLTIKNKSTGDISRAQKLTIDLSEDIVGHWDSPVNAKNPEKCIKFNSDNSFSAKGITESINGDYHIYKNFLVMCGPSDGFTSALLTPGHDDLGPLLINQDRISENGTDESFTFAKQLGDFTIDMLEGRWIQDNANGDALEPIDLGIDCYEINDGECTETFYLRWLEENNRYSWVHATGNAYIIRGLYLSCNYSEPYAKELYKILKITEDKYMIQTLEIDGTTNADKGDIYSASKIVEEPKRNQLIGEWEGTVYIDETENFNSNFTISEKDGKLTYVDKEAEITISGNIYLYGPEVVVLEQTSPSTWCDVFYVSFSKDGKKMFWRKWMLTLYNDLENTYEARAVFTKK